MKKVIAIDFDGTLFENKWPEIGMPIAPNINRAKNEKANGAVLILWTCRRGEQLEEALFFCLVRGLVFDAVNENLPETIEKFGGDSRKIFADLYIDDRCAGPWELSAGHSPAKLSRISYD